VSVPVTKTSPQHSSGWIFHGSVQLSSLLVPPTEERVSECLDVAGLALSDIIGVERVRQRPITAEKAAINAVLAGCLPSYRSLLQFCVRCATRNTTSMGLQAQVEQRRSLLSMVQSECLSA
jgi:hypothetical protein